MVKDATRRKRGPIGVTDQLSSKTRYVNHIPSATTASMTRSAVGHGIERMKSLVYQSSRKSMAVHPSGG